MPPRVSVILPAYNCAPYVAEAVESVLRQTVADIEVLAGDDCSTDNTRDILDAFRDPRIRRQHNDVNLGPGEMRARLLTHATGEFIAFQDADDVSLPHRFEEQLHAFDRDPELWLCGGQCERTTPAGRRLSVQRKPLTHEEILRVIETGESIPFCCSTAVFRRSVLDEVGSFRSYFNRTCCEDLDLLCRIAERHKAINLGRVVYRYRSNPLSFSRTSSRHRFYAPQIVAFLARERRSEGTDSLMRGDHAALAALVEELDRPFVKDPTLEHRREAGALVSLGEHGAALRASLLALRRDPGRLANYRALLYCVRRSIFRSTSADAGARSDAQGH